MRLKAQGESGKGKTDGFFSLAPCTLRLDVYSSILNKIWPLKYNKFFA